MFTIAGESLSDMELPIPQDPTHRTTSRKPKLYPVLLRETYLAQDLEGKLLLSMLNMTHHLLHQNTTIINSFLRPTCGTKCYFHKEKPTTTNH